MTDIVAFLTARLDEDAKRWQTIWRFQAGDKRIDGWWDLGGTLGRAVSSVVDPTRGGRDVAAKRKLIELHAPEDVEYVDGDGQNRNSLECTTCDNGGTSNTWPCATVKLLAAPYADHPDYDPAWAVA